MKETTYVGMDVHKKDIVVALLRPDTAEFCEWRLHHEPRAVRRLAKRLRREAIGELQCVYEAGPCGYTLQWQLLREGIPTDVVVSASKQIVAMLVSWRWPVPKCSRSCIRRRKARKRCATCAAAARPRAKT